MDVHQSSEAIDGRRDSSWHFAASAFYDLAPSSGLIPSPFRRSASSLHLQEWGNGRVSHERPGGFRYQISLRVDHETSVQDFAGANIRACARPAEADSSSEGGGDHTRCGGTGSDPHAGVGAAGHGASQVGAVSEEAAIAEAPRRILGTAQA